MGNVNKQLDRHQLFDIQKRTTLSAKEIKEWYSLFIKQFQDTKVSKDKYLSSLKVHSLPSSYETTISPNINSNNSNSSSSNNNGNNGIINPSSSSSSSVSSSPAASSSSHTMNNSTSGLNNNHQSTGGGLLSVSAASTATTASNEIIDQKQVVLLEIEQEKKEMTTSTAPNNGGGQQQQQQETKKPQPLTDLTYPELVYDTTHLSFLKYFYSEDYPSPNYRKTNLQFVHFIPSYEIYLKGNRVSQADWTYTAITSKKRMDDTLDTEKKKNIQLAISFHDLSVFFEVIYGYLKLRPFELEKLPKHLHSPEACTRFVFQSVLNFVGMVDMNNNNNIENLESKSITKQQFMDYCFHKLSQESINNTTMMQQQQQQQFESSSLLI